MLDILLNLSSQNQNIIKDKFESVSDAEENLYEFDRFSDELSQIRHDAVKIAGKITTQQSEIKQLEAEILNIKEY